LQQVFWGRYLRCHHSKSGKKSDNWIRLFFDFFPLSGSGGHTLKTHRDINHLPEANLSQKNGGDLSHRHFKGILPKTVSSWVSVSGPESYFLHHFGFFFGRLIFCFSPLHFQLHFFIY
jgi:hypothetical protein